MEVNPFFEKQFFEKQKDHPHIKMERYVVGSAEDMKDIEDGSIDIVVSTLVLCSVPNVQAALKEIQRVLAPVCTPAINWFSCFDYFQISIGWKILLLGAHPGKRIQIRPNVSTFVFLHVLRHRLWMSTQPQKRRNNSIV